MDRIFEYRFIQSNCYSFSVINVEFEYMFDTLGFLWLHHESPPYLLKKLVDGLPEERTRPRLRSSTTTTLQEVTIGINQSFLMELVTAADVCDGNFQSKNITVHGNATTIKLTLKIIFCI